MDSCYQLNRMLMSIFTVKEQNTEAQQPLSPIRLQNALPNEDALPKQTPIEPSLSTHYSLIIKKKIFPQAGCVSEDENTSLVFVGG